MAKLAAEGATVVVTDRDEGGAVRTAAALPDAVAMRRDVTDRDAVQEVVAEVVRRLGRIDVLVNNAGWDNGVPFLESDPGDRDRAIAINLYGVLHTVYSAAKGGVIAFTKSLAREMARYRVRVNCVCPGPTDTALFASMGGEKLREALIRAIPFRRPAEPADVANVVAFLASDEASFVTGQTVSLSGGLTMS